MRLDLYMVKEGLATGRDRAKELISEGKVKLYGKVCTKPSAEVGDTKDSDAAVELLEHDNYVGRGALKLKKAFSVFGADVCGRICIDAGASTGGFTQYMLEGGAKFIYAVDVGEGQLAKRLREDKRVANLEKTDIRSVKLPDKPSFFTADVAFISLKQILFPIYALTSDNASGICLIKPQFEAGREFVGKKGVVKDKLVQAAVIKSISEYAEGIGFFTAGLDFSPIKGQNGNIEYLIYLKKEKNDYILNADETVKKAWEELV